MAEGGRKSGGSGPRRPAGPRHAGAGRGGSTRGGRPGARPGSGRAGGNRPGAAQNDRPGGSRSDARPGGGQFGSARPAGNRVGNYSGTPRSDRPDNAHPGGAGGNRSGARYSAAQGSRPGAHPGGGRTSSGRPGARPGAAQRGQPVAAGHRPARPRRAAAAPAKGERIAKLLARAGVGSRREVEQMITAGRIAIDGTPLTTPATILTSLAGVTIDGNPAPETDATRVFLFHKPVGVLTASRDHSGRPTIYDVLPDHLPRLMPVGRLDLNTEGLLLLTNDGELKRALELPVNEVPRSYRIRALGAVRQAQLEALATGVSIAGVHYGPVDASLERRARPDGANVWLAMTLREGRNREVRRLCESLGLKVSRLIRTSYGPFALADLPVRSVIEVPAAEVARLKRSLARP